VSDHRGWIGLAAAGALISTHAGSPPTARAETAGADDGRLGRFLEVAASQGRSERTAGAIVHATMALALVPPGVLLATRSDAGLQVAGATLLVRGWLQALDLGYALLPSGAEWLRDHHAERMSQGATAATATAETEHEWRNVMENAHDQRGLLGALEVGVGGVEVAAGMALLLDSGTVLSWTRQEQTIWGVVLTGIGLEGLSAGLWRLLGTTRLEELWALYESGARPGASRHGPSLAVAPVPRGAVGTMALSF
jgi:hypothetical protein